MAAALNLSRNNDHFNGSYNSEITLSLRIMEYSISDRTSDMTPKGMTGSEQSASTQTLWKLAGELWGQNSKRAARFPAQWTRSARSQDCDWNGFYDQR